MIFITAIILYIALVFASKPSLKKDFSARGVVFIIHSIALFFLIHLFQDLPSYLRKEHIEAETAMIVERGRTAVGYTPNSFQVYLEDGRQYGGAGRLFYGRWYFEGKPVRLFVLPHMHLLTKLEVKERDGSYTLLYTVDGVIVFVASIIFFPLVTFGVWMSAIAKAHEHTPQSQKKRKYKRGNLGRGP